MRYAHYLKHKYFKLSFVAGGLGVLFLAWQKEWLILRSPWAPTVNLTQLAQQFAGTKQKITLYYWTKQQWQQEASTLVCTANPQKDYKQLVTSWLNWLSEEQLVNQRPVLQTALLDQQTKTLYLNFDRSLFTGEEPVQTKLALIESLLKTLRSAAMPNGTPVQAVRFLVTHQTMPDPHLDFTVNWPVQGFLN